MAQALRFFVDLVIHSGSFAKQTLVGLTCGRVQMNETQLQTSEEQITSSRQDRAHKSPRDLGAKFRMWFDKEHICVLTIGKTASSAIIQGFIDAGVPAFQAHSLHKTPQEYLFVAGLPDRRLQNAAFQVKTQSWLWLSKRMHKRFVTTFRDPFARNMSAFFEQSWKLDAKVETMTTPDLIALYERHGPHDVTRTWFDRNLTQTFGLRLEDVDLKSQSTQVLRVANRRFLLMKYEDQTPWTAALRDFSGTPVSLTRRNDSTRKPYSEAMSRLKKAWRPSPEIVTRSIDPGLWNAIYTDTEKQMIRERWNIPAEAAP